MLHEIKPYVTITTTTTTNTTTTTFIIFWFSQPYYAKINFRDSLNPTNNVKTLNKKTVLT